MRYFISQSLSNLSEISTSFEHFCAFLQSLKKPGSNLQHVTCNTIKLFLFVWTFPDMICFEKYLFLIEMHTISVYVWEKKVWVKILIICKGIKNNSLMRDTVLEWLICIFVIENGQASLCLLVKLNKKYIPHGEHQTRRLSILRLPYKKQLQSRWTANYIDSTDDSFIIINKV